MAVDERLGGVLVCQVNAPSLSWVYPGNLALDAAESLDRELLWLVLVHLTGIDDAVAALNSTFG
jgi:hypothetical protein